MVRSVQKGEQFDTNYFLGTGEYFLDAMDCFLGSRELFLDARESVPGNSDLYLGARDGFLGAR